MSAPEQNAAAGPGQDDDVDVGLGAGLLYRVGHVLEHVGGDGVERVGPVDLDAEGAVVEGHLDLVAGTGSGAGGHPR